MADVQLTASIDAAGFNRGINEMKHSLKDLQDTGNMTYDRLDSGFKSVENRLTSTGASVRRLETAFSRYATAMSQDLQMVAGASTQVGQKVDAASQKMAQDMRNLVQAVNQLHTAFTTLLQPVRNIDSQSAQTVTQLRNIVNEMRTLNSAVQQTNAQLQNMTSSTTSNTQANNANAASFDKQQSSIRSVKDIMQAVLALGFGTQFAKEVAEATGYMVQLEASFRVLLGSATEARNMMGDLVNFAMKTPFDLKGTADAAKQLLAYGIAAEDVIETERRLGDIGAALGLTMRDLAYLYGTTKTQGRLYALDMRQFTTRGIPMLETLSKQLNVTTADITKMVTAGQIGFKEVKNAIWAMTDEGGQFGGLMEEQFNTIKGQLSNLGDAWYQFLAALGKSADIEFGLTDGIADFNDKLNQLSQNADVIIETIEVLGKTLMLVGAIQGVAWLTKMITSMLAFGTVLGTTATQVNGVNLQMATGATIAGNLRASWMNAANVLRNFGSIATATGSRMAAAAVAARTLGTAISATMPYIGLAMAVYGVVQSLIAWNRETDTNEQSMNALAKAAVSADTQISKMYTTLLATSEGTEEHSKAIDKLIGKLVENNVVSKEYCDSLTTETAKTQLLIDKKKELADIERNKQIRSAADTQRETILENDQDEFSKQLKGELDHINRSYQGEYQTDFSEHIVYDFDIDDHVAKEKLDALYSQAANMLGFIRTEMAVAWSDYNSGAITAEERQEKINNLQLQGQRTIETIAKQYTNSAESANELQKALEKAFNASTRFKGNFSLASGEDMAENFSNLVDNLSSLEAITQGMTGSYSNPASEYAAILEQFKNVSNASAYTANENFGSSALYLNGVLDSIETLETKLSEISADPKLIRLDIEQGALHSLEQFVDHGKDQIQSLVDYAREHPTEFTANIDEIEANMNSIVQKMEADPDHWKEHTTQFTGELTALNNALNTGAEDIERFKKNHGKIDIDFGVILRNNSLKLVEGMLEKLKKAFEALGLEDAVKRIDAALASVRQRVAAVDERNAGSHNTPGDRLAATRSSYKSSGTAPDLNTYNDYTTQELEARVKDIKASLKKLKDDEEGNKAKDDLNEELDAINAELTQRSPSKSQAAAEKKRKAAEMARREADRKRREDERREKAAEALDKLMRKHALSLDEAIDANIIDEYQRRLAELENEREKKLNSIKDDRITAERKAEESGREGRDLDGDKKIDTYLNDEEIATFDNEALEAEKTYLRKRQDIFREELQLGYDMLDAYGTLEEKRYAIIMEYEDKISRTTSEKRRKLLEAQRDEELSKLNAESFGMGIDWSQKFDGIGNVLQDVAKETLAKLDEFMKKDEYKNLPDAQQKPFLELRKTLTENGGVKTKSPFNAAAWAEIGKLTESYKNSVKNYIEAQKKHAQAVQKLILAQQELENATDEAAKNIAKDKVADAEKEVAATKKDLKDAKNKKDEDNNNLSDATTAATQGLRNFETILGQLTSGTLSGLADGVANLVKVFSKSGSDIGDLLGMTGTKIGMIISAILKLLDALGEDPSKFISDLLEKVIGVVDGVITQLQSGELIQTLLAEIIHLVGDIIMKTLVETTYNAIKHPFAFFGIGDYENLTSSFYDDFDEAQQNARNQAAMDQMTTALLENTKALNDWLGDQGFAGFVSNLNIAFSKYKDFFNRAESKEIEYRDKNAKVIEWAAGHHQYSVTARQNLKIQTREDSSWKGERTENLEDYIRNNYGKELFDSRGRLNMDVYNAFKNTSDYAKLKDYTKTTLEELVKLEEEYKKILEELTEYYSDLYSPLGDALVDAVWDWYDNGVDALDSFHDKASDTFRQIANELMYEMLQTEVFSKYRDRISAAIRDYTEDTSGRGQEAKEQAFRNSLMQIGAELGADLQVMIPTLEQTIEILDRELGQYGFSFNSANAQTATSGAFEGMTSDQADALEGRFTAVQGYTARITEILEDWYKNGVIYRENYTPAGSPEQVAYSPVVNPTTPEVNVDFTDLQQELKDVKEVMEKTNSNIVAFNTSFNTAHVDTSDTLDTIAGRTASLQRQEELLRRMSKDVAEI